MKTILINVYANSINTSILRQRLEQLSASCYVISSTSFLIRYMGSTKDIYDSIYDIINDTNVFVCEINTLPGEYWGYMDKSLWDWMKDNA